MAIYHFAAQIMGRSDGKSSVAAAAYRSCERLTDVRTGIDCHYTRRQERVVHVEIMAPHDAPAWTTDRQTLWNRVEAVEKRKDAQLCREFEVSLPVELTFNQQVDLIRGFVREQILPHGLATDVAVHVDPDRRNPHAHLMMPMRAFDGDGFGLKARHLNSNEQLLAWRARWADHVNAALAQARQTARVDHRSFEAQGVDREATIHEGYTAQRIEAQGGVADRCEINRGIRARNAAREAAAAEAQPTKALEPVTVSEAINQQEQVTGASWIDLTPSVKAPDQVDGATRYALQPDIRAQLIFGGPPPRAEDVRHQLLSRCQTLSQRSLDVLSRKSGLGILQRPMARSAAQRGTSSLSGVLRVSLGSVVQTNHEGIRSSVQIGVLLRGDGPRGVLGRPANNEVRAAGGHDREGQGTEGQGSIGPAVTAAVMPTSKPVAIVPASGPVTSTISVAVVGAPVPLKPTKPVLPVRTDAKLGKQRDRASAAPGLLSRVSKVVSGVAAEVWQTMPWQRAAEAKRIAEAEAKDRRAAEAAAEEIARTERAEADRRAQLAADRRLWQQTELEACIKRAGPTGHEKLIVMTDGQLHLDMSKFTDADRKFIEGGSVPKSIIREAIAERKRTEAWNYQQGEPARRKYNADMAAKNTQTRPVEQTQQAVRTSSAQMAPAKSAPGPATPASAAAQRAFIASQKGKGR